MLNRQQSRALTRAPKKTHKLIPQTCVLWVPSARGYVARFAHDGFRIVEHAEQAKLFGDDHASSSALTLFELFGLHAEVRPYHAMAFRQGGLRSIGSYLEELQL